MEISIVKLKKVVDGLIDWVRDDLVDNELTPNSSWLYTVFNDVILDDHNFYTQLRELIIRGDEDSRKFETRLMFDKERANLPTLHIHYPNEDASGDNTVTMGYLRDIDVNGIETDFYSRSFIGQYELIITGGNSLEVVMLYEFMDALLIAAADTLTYNFDIYKFNGKQLMSNPDIIPYLTFYRSIGISIQAKKIVPSLIRRVSGKDVTFVGDYYTDNQKEGLGVSVSIESSNLGDIYTFNATIVSIANVYSIKWYMNNVEISDQYDFELELTLATTGSYVIKCEVSNHLGLIPNPATSNEITITVS